jgi:hypothetical protein
VPDPIKLDESQSEEHGDMEDDEVIESNPKAVPKVMALGALESE